MPTNVYDVTQPPDTQLANLLGQDLRNLALNVQQRMALVSGPAASIWNPATDAQPTNWTGLLYFAIDTGHVFQWNGAAWVDVASSIGGRYKVESSNVTPVSATNTTVETTLMTFLLPANELTTVGQVLRITANFATGNSSGIDNIIIKVKSDTTVLFTTTIVNNILQQGTPLTFVADCVLTAVGAAGALNCQSRWFSEGIAGTNVAYFLVNGTPSIDTTANHTISVTAQHSALGAGNTITQNMMLIERLG